MARQGRREEENRTPLFTSGLVRFGKRITPAYAQEELKAARFTIRDQYIVKHPYEGTYYEATVDVYEVLPGYQVICLNGVPIISSVEG